MQELKARGRSARLLQHQHQQQLCWGALSLSPGGIAAWRLLLLLLLLLLIPLPLLRLALSSFSFTRAKRKKGGQIPLLLLC